MKKVAVTGACGFVGTTLVGELLKENTEVLALDLPHLENRFPYKDKVPFIGIDVTNKETLQKALDASIETVFHTAALFKLGAPYQLLYKVNTEGTKNLCEVMLEKGISRLINWGSSSEYGFWDDPKLIKDETFPIKEKDLVVLYTKSKREQELVAESFVPKGLKLTTLRPGNIYGPGTPNGLAIPLYFFKKGILRMIPGFKEIYSSHIHVEDVARAAVHLAKLPESVNQIYNIVDSYPLSSFETMEIIAKALNSWVFPSRKKTLGIPIFHTPPVILKLSGILEEWRAKIFGGFPLFERNSVNFLVKNHIVSNKKLLGTGFVLKWPNVSEALPQVITWYEKTNWEIFKSKR